jgi:GntR family transcriptional regulator
MPRPRARRENGPERPLVGAAAGYALLFADLGQRIGAGEWKPGEQIPSERQLCETYGVSRPVVRQALELGERDGLLVRVPGKGTFVARPRVIQELSRMTTFEATLEQHELTADRRVVRSGRELAPAGVAEQLGISPTTPALYLEVVGLADGRPLALYQSYMTPAAAEAAAVDTLLAGSDGGLPRRWYAQLAEALGAPHLIADQLYEAVELDVASAGLLDAPAGAPAFKVSTIFSLPGGAPVEARVAIYPGDRYAFRIHRVLADEDAVARAAGVVAGRGS